MDDIISRKFLIEAFKEKFFYDLYTDDFNYVLKWLENLPAADSSEFCDQLWKIAYEQGKKSSFVPSEPMTGLYVVGFNDGYKAGKEDAEPEIIRCKDCRWWGVSNTCGHWDAMVTAVADGFCSYAERRSDG